MKLITRKTDYAVRSLKYIAEKKQMVPISELVANLNIPRPFLRGILQELEKKDIVNSRKGRGGGFALKLAPQKILLTDLIRIFQGQVKLTECVIKMGACPEQSCCPLKRKMDKIEKYVVSELKAITIKSLSE